MVEAPSVLSTRVAAPTAAACPHAGALAWGNHPHGPRAPLRPVAARHPWRASAPAQLCRAAAASDGNILGLCQSCAPAGSSGAAQRAGSRLAVRKLRALSRRLRFARLELELEAAAELLAARTTKSQSAAIEYRGVHVAGGWGVEVEAIFCRTESRTAAGALEARRSELRELSARPCWEGTRSAEAL